ncbi:MAG: CTP synthase [Peptoniphilaceae bacterium]|nr:CTP synthase [Peptoniphilaceae bacterium]MDD7383342.1 CTP synthase [Peptoniphilaceae bacterium]MDY3738287.1 CTP synthase [Peptoniphilaceae bacterium]
MSKQKFIFVTGGVVSGIGKGITAASIGRMLKDMGFSIFMQKFDPYLNIDPGTMNPYQHGEVFVTKDGGETDLDLGHYERFTDVELTKDSSVTSGKIYDSVLSKERRGDFGGRTVQVIPHITNEIKNRVYKVADETNADIIITEIGGTVGDIESQPFFEAIRQIHAERPEDVLFVHTTLVPAIPGTKELKTKPTQHSYKQLMSFGIQPDVFVLRAEYKITDEIKEKIALFCDVPLEGIVQSENVDLIYEVPLSFEKQNLDNYIVKKLNLETKISNDKTWEKMVEKFKNADKEVNIALCGKYTELVDAYLSVNEALLDSGYNLGCKVNISYFDSELINRENIEEKLRNIDGILVPGGFGSRGINGMIEASKYAREKNIPYLGVCLGMQIAVIDILRNLAGIKDANSLEFDENTKNPVINIMEDKKYLENIGGTLRLGNWTCKLKENSKAREIYGKDEILERHRHRYEVNDKYVELLEKNNVVISGRNPKTNLVEIIEIPKNDFYMGSQFHPEFKSRPNNPSPLYFAFVKASLEKKLK